jgi:hypothetical protein
VNDQRILERSLRVRSFFHTAWASRAGELQPGNDVESWTDDELADLWLASALLWPSLSAAGHQSSTGRSLRHRRVGDRHGQIRTWLNLTTGAVRIADNPRLEWVVFAQPSLGGIGNAPRFIDLGVELALRAVDLRQHVSA